MKNPPRWPPGTHYSHFRARAAVTVANCKARDSVEFDVLKSIPQHRSDKLAVHTRLDKADRVAVEPKI